ncbi:hypothetical protein [Aquibacillus saliphilus]|uniref:hypothetical protein n=1 Tax=Aquibacillus saliphilus TaxID=1909422 RepID=UPI001CEFFBB4|nr:hypothetical protein [Aquibacillus saliphilus]
MNELQAIKEEIFNLGLVKPLLESVGCDEVKQNGNRMEGTRPNGDNNRAFSVYLDEQLTAKVWTRDVKTGDIYDLISYFKFNKDTPEGMKTNLNKSKQYIINTLKLKGFKNVKEDGTPDYNFHLRKHNKKKKLHEPNPTLEESVLNEFVNLPFDKWISEDGIEWETQKEFEIGFDILSERVTFPVRSKEGSIVGIRGRATRIEDEHKAKYLPIYSFSKSKELFNLHRALPHIIKTKTVIVFEAEKSTMLAHQFGHKNTVAIMGSDLSEIQATMLKSIFPNLRIVTGFDKDKTISKTKEMVYELRDYDNLFGIYDTEDILIGKEAPVDQGKDVFENLYYNHCHRIS